MFFGQFQIGLLLSLVVHGDDHTIHAIGHQGHRDRESAQRIGRGHIGIFQFGDNQAHLGIGKRLLAELAQDAASHHLRDLEGVLRLGDESLEHAGDVIAAPSLGEHEHVEMTSTLASIYAVVLFKVVSRVVNVAAQVALQQ